MTHAHYVRDTKKHAQCMRIDSMRPRVQTEEESKQRAHKGCACTGHSLAFRTIDHTEAAAPLCSINH